MYILVKLVELGFIISKTAKYIKKEDYKDYIESYFICLDISDRTLQKGIVI